MSPTILKRHASPTQRADYLECGLEILTGLGEAIRLLELERATTADPDRRAEIESYVSDLQAAHDEVQADLVGFLSDSFRLRPLSAADLDQIRETSLSLYSMFPGRTCTSEVLEAAATLVSGWRETHPSAEAPSHLRLVAS